MRSFTELITAVLAERLEQPDAAQLAGQIYDLAKAEGLLGPPHRRPRRRARVSTGLALPPDVADALERMHAVAVPDSVESRRLSAYLHALRAKGWTLDCLAQPLGITHEGVRQRVLRATDEPFDAPVPDVPQLPVSPPPAPKRPARPTLSDSDRAELRQLHELASRCRGRTPVDHPARRASEEFSSKLAELKRARHTYTELGRAVNLTAGAIRARLKMHGYSRRPPSMKAYEGGKDRAAEAA